MEEKTKLENSLEKLIDNKKFSVAKELLITMNPSDINDSLKRIGNEKVSMIFRLLPKDLAAETFVEMDPDLQSFLVQQFNDFELKEILDELFVDDVVDIIEEMPANVVKRILSKADSNLRADINRILQYPDNSAGSLMTTEYVSLRPSMNIEESIAKIRENAIDKETIYTCYVTEKSKLVGVVTVRDLLVQKDQKALIKDIMKKNVISTYTFSDKEEVAKMFSKYNFIALPVVDKENSLVGIITFDDAMDVMQEEASEDMEIMAALTPSEKTYLKSSSLDLFKNRIPWLLLLMVSATFTGLIISNFEDALAAQVALTAFIPMLMDTGGNAGSQASVTIIRAISLNEVTFKDLPKIIGKELGTAFLSALILGIVCFLKIMIFDYYIMNNHSINTTIALVVCLTLCCTVTLAKFVGAVLPMFAKKLGFDPAVMASPLITTIVDALSLFVYFQLATGLLHI